MPVGLWNKFPHGGNMRMPVYQKPAVKVLTGSVGKEDLLLGDRLAAYRMRATGEHKIGAAGGDGNGPRGGSLRARRSALPGDANFFVNPSAEYVDVPWAEPKDLGYAIQVCNGNSALGSFSKLEYHTAALKTSEEHRPYKDASQTWAFRGTQEQIDFIAKMLLGAEQIA